MGFLKKKITWDDEEDEPPEEVPQQNIEVQTTIDSDELREQSVAKEMEPHKPIVARTVTKNSERRITSRTERLNRLPVNDRMDLMADVAASVIEGTIPCCLIGGSPGLGKTHTVVEELLKKRFKRVEHEDYIVIKAGVSAFGVYKFVVSMAEKAKQARASAKGKQDNGRKVKPKVPVIVFDDVSFWQDKRFVDLLKALMDTSDKRIVSWLTDRAELDPEEAKKLGKLPAQVEYSGGVIVITNEEEKKMNNAILDRTVYLPIEVNDEEMQERMRHLVNRLEPGMDKELKIKVLNWLLSNEYEGEERSMRTLVKSLKLVTPE